MKKLMMFAAALTMAFGAFAGASTVVPSPVQSPVMRVRSVGDPVFTAKDVTVSASAATNSWAAPIQVVQTAAKIRINAINITVLPDGKIAVIVQWAWLDASDKIVRNGITRYNESEIALKLAAKGASIDQFRQLFLAIAAEEAVAP